MNWPDNFVCTMLMAAGKNPAKIVVGVGGGGMIAGVLVVNVEKVGE